MLGKARGILDEAEASLRGHPSMYHAGFLHDAQKEYAEGKLTLAPVGAAFAGPRTS